ncbi:hypothetical protein [Microbacterium pumilum]|uniref:PRC-barrel domain-containing protein n=1 Tax=Microbacterium pumilum TaxID=344165 RepID=A0ABP5D5N9_9MICO
MSELDDLLGNLSEVSTKTTVRGVAVGKSGDRLHVAVRTGVIAIPIAEIADLRRVETLTSGSEVVEVDMERPETIVQVFKVRPFLAGERNDPSLLYASASNTTSTDLSTVTSTLSGGVLDQTDDGSTGSELDDSGTAVLESASF